jgi:hypothetical protein
MWQHYIKLLITLFIYSWTMHISKVMLENCENQNQHPIIMYLGNIVTCLISVMIFCY